MKRAVLSNLGEDRPGSAGRGGWMSTVIAVLGIVPGAAYFSAMVGGLAFGVTRPAEYLVVALLAPAWSELVFYALVLGGCALTALLGLCAGERQNAQGSCMRVLGGIAVLLLVFDTPMSLWQFHRMLAHSM